MKTQKRTKRVLFFIVILFVILLLYLAFFQIAKSDKLAKSPNNSRNWVDESEFKRGSIKDRNGEVLVESVQGEDGNYRRNYYYGPLFAHVLGYSSVDYGKTGLEQSFNNELLNVQKETPIDDIKKRILEQKEGKNLITSLDLSLQEEAGQLLEGHKGSIVLMDVRTGDIYAMMNLPSFDPNYLKENWDQLANDPDSALLNRACQGLYTPGSAIKVISSVAILESGVDLNYYDEGYTIVDGYRINNFENHAYGNINMRWALVQSANTYFADKALEVGPEKFQEVFNKFLFNSQIDFDLDLEKSTAPFEAGMDPNEFAAGAYGQGKTLVTPLQMALSISAIANDGEMVQPRLVKGVEDNKSGDIKSYASEGKVIAQVTDEETALELKDYLGTVVDNYPSATTNNTTSAGKTGTAETEDLTHAWYVGFAPRENPKLAVAVILEKDGSLGGTTAAPIGAAMLDAGILRID